MYWCWPHLQLGRRRHLRLLLLQERGGARTGRAARLLLRGELLLQLLLLRQRGAHARGEGDARRLVRNFVSDFDVLPPLLCEYLRELVDVARGVGEGPKLEPASTQPHYAVC